MSVVIHFGPASRTKCGKESRNITKDVEKVTCKTCRARLGLVAHPWVNYQFRANKEWVEEA